MWGGNSLNIIRIPSLNEVKTIIISSDLNGSINIKDINTWQFIKNYNMWSQNDTKGSAYIIRTQAIETLYDKSITHYTVVIENRYMIELSTHFCPVIEFRE